MIASTPEQRIERLTHYLLKLEKRLQKPFEIIDEENVRGFRYGSPNIIHYVVISIANSIATANSSLLLLNSGYYSQAAMLLRNIMETISKLSYVLAGIEEGRIDKKAETFLNDFFSDNQRPVEKRTPYRGISLKDLHRRNSEKITRDIKKNKEIGIQPKKENTDDRYARIQSDIYADLSNHIHGRYPELMNIFGQFSRELKLNGNLESIDVDARYHEQFLELLAGMLERKLKLALLALYSTGHIKLDEDERAYCFEGGI